MREAERLQRGDRAEALAGGVELDQRRGHAAASGKWQAARCPPATSIEQRASVVQQRPRGGAARVERAARRQTRAAMA